VDRGGTHGMKLGKLRGREEGERLGAFCGVASGGIFPDRFIQRPAYAARRGRYLPSAEFPKLPLPSFLPC
jgi:hypothetical protein